MMGYPYQVAGRGKLFFFKQKNFWHFLAALKYFLTSNHAKAGHGFTFTQLGCASGPALAFHSPISLSTRGQAQGRPLGLSCLASSFQFFASASGEALLAPAVFPAMARLRCVQSV